MSSSDDLQARRSGYAPDPAPLEDPVAKTTTVVRSPQAPPAQVRWDPRTATWVDSGSGAPRPPRDRTGLRAGLAGALAGALVALAVAIPVARFTTPAGTVVERRLAEGLAPGGEGSIVEIAARARPWVVNINVATRQPTPLGDLEVQGTGSGVILRSDGHIITNAHVVESAVEIEVTLASGERLPGTVVGLDPETDIAVVKVDRDDLPAAIIGSVRDVQVGETAVAIGSPLGLEQSVTSGIISALGRRVPRAGNQSALYDMIQTDAPITHGNSGGALINHAGAVVGINAAIGASPEVGAEGVAFAIPIDVAVAVAEELISTGRATHPWLGVMGSNITPETAEQFGVQQGAFISEVIPGSPADRAGLVPNDIVISLQGERITSMDDLVVGVRQHGVGEEVQLLVVRDGRRLTLRATLGDKPDDI